MYASSIYKIDVQGVNVNRYTFDCMKREQKTAPFQIRMRPSVKAAAEQAAADANRSLSSMIETLLIEHLRANGYLPAGEDKPQEVRKKGTS
jgi:hypothetical protein